MNRFIIRWAINAVALYLAVFLVPGVTLVGGDVVSFIWLALIFGAINALVRPIIAMLTCPLIVLTLGLGTLILNTGMLYILEWIAGFFNIGFTLAGFWPAFLGALVVSAVSIFLSLVLRDELKKKH